MENIRKPLPRIREETRGFWEGCKRHELFVQRCKDCGAYRFPPALGCHKCGSENREWVKVSGKGDVYSFAIPRGNKPEGVHPAFAAEVPYAVVLVELPDAGGVHIVSNITGCRLEDIAIGMPVEVTYDDVTTEITLPKFRPSHDVS